MAPALLLSILAGYLLGSIPSAYLIARAHGIDIFAVGTGNPGAANTFRSVGRRAGLMVFFADMVKGAVALGLALLLGVESLELRIIAGGAAVVGHGYPVFLRFRGGAGLAPLAGVATAALPLAAIAAWIPTLLVLWCARSTGHAAGAGFATFLIVGTVVGEPLAAVAVTAIAAVVLIHSKLVTDKRTLPGSAQSDQRTNR